MRVIFRFTLPIRLFFSFVVFIGVSGLVNAQTPDPQKIIGSWAMVNPPERFLVSEVLVQFTADKKMKVATTVKDKRLDKKDTISEEATYTIEGKKLEIIFTKRNGDKVTKTETIESLSDDKLVTVNQKNQKTEFKKVK